MNDRQFELADILRHHGPAYLERYGTATSSEQRRVMDDIVRCRTPALGGQIKQCDRCGHTLTVFHSCRNRHCPKCQAAARAEWLDAQAQNLLQCVDYHHLVFTIPAPVASVALQNKSVVYAILFRACSETLKSIARDPKRLGAHIGFLAVLHTWGQQLHHHPHIHCVVPGGGLSPDGRRWVPCRKGFFLPVRVLSALFKRKFLDYLNAAFERGELSFSGSLATLGDHDQWKRLLRTLYDTKWVVYAKPPFGGATQVLKYLARYTHRVAIANQRLISLQDGKVTFRWKDYTSGNIQRHMTLDAVEFIRRFLLHTLPSGFMRIRHYGFLSNRTRQEKLALCRRLLGIAESTLSPDAETSEAIDNATGDEERSQRCPACKEGYLYVIAYIPHFVGSVQRNFRPSRRAPSGVG